MAKLRHLFLRQVEQLFNIFEEAVRSGVYHQGNENNFTVEPSEGEPSVTSCVIRCIFEQLREKDVSLLAFSPLIQPNDIFGLIPCGDVTVPMNSSGGYVVFSEGTYYVVGYQKDPMDIIYNVLLRKN